VNVQRVDQRQVGDVLMVERWLCPPPAPGQPYITTLQTWHDNLPGDRISVCDIYQWEPL
jgi:hypothetical protein